MQNPISFNGEVSHIIADKEVSSGVLTVSARITQHNGDHTHGYFAIRVTTLVDGEEQDYRLGTPSQEYSYLFNGRYLSFTGIYIFYLPWSLLRVNVAG